MRTVGMGVKKEDPDAKLRAEMEAQIEHNADLMAENARRVGGIKALQRGKG